MARLYGVLMERFHISLHPVRYWSVSQLVTAYQPIRILNNMCVERRRSSFLSRRRRAVGSACGTNTGVGGDAGHAPGVGDGQSGGLMLSELPPPRDLHLEAAPPMAPAAS